MQVFEEDFPGVEHRFCVRHLYANFKQKFGGGTEIRDLLMWASKATYKELWEEKMQQIKAINEDAYKWLMTIPTIHWCRHAFSFYPKCDVTMNNLSEAFNCTILVARDKPVITMFEWIRKYLMNRFATLREKSKGWKGNVMPKPRKRLDREINYSGRWVATWVAQGLFQVEHAGFEDQFIVDIEKQTCTCNFWELNGIPCRHAVSCLSDRGLNPENYVHDYYKKTAYNTCYEHIISPINGENKWPKLQQDDILPPEIKRGPGRPKKLRRREPDEPDKKNPTKLRRGGSSYTCSRCHKKGHNQRKCPLPPPSEDALDDGHIEEENEPEQHDFSQVFDPSSQDVSPSAPSTQEAPPAANANANNQQQSPPPPLKAPTTRSRNQAAAPAPPAATAIATANNIQQAPPHARSRKQPAAPQPPQLAAAARATKPAAQPKKPAAKPKKPVAAASNQRGKKRGADNEIGHWIPGEHASGIAGKGDKGKGKATVASQDQPKKRVIKRRWI
ncbi:uncharacterized protein LOC130732221 [Lotus japonicus]|uniref:uncharacterized protein LOC130732221 n=1 Tax=Lotus japonicus TaxID=34305 RepID=UPI00258E40ED|nr:uncharacterized protein LOC130732221 [Lotus japonicus]